MSGQQQRTKNVGVWVEESDFLEINITAIGKDILLKIDEATELTIKCKKGLQIMIPDPNKTKTQAAKAESVMMVGHVGELASSSAAIAISLSGVSDFSLPLDWVLLEAPEHHMNWDQENHKSHHVFGYSSGNEKEVVDYVTNMAPLVRLSAILDSVQGLWLYGIGHSCRSIKDSADFQWHIDAKF
ncbi:hypothetical protein AAG906_029631 [Vitis piasezkii]